MDTQQAGAMSVFYCMVVLGVWIVTVLRGQHVPTRRAAQGYFMLCASIHSNALLSSTFRHDDDDGNQTRTSYDPFIGGFWGKFNLSDSRYTRSEVWAINREVLTAAIEGSLALLTYVGFLKRSSYRYAMQLILSWFQLYDKLRNAHYVLIDIYLHFSFYFVFFNSLWIIIPFILFLDSAKQIGASQAAYDLYINEYNRHHRL